MSHARYLIGDATTVLATLPDDSVDLILTSPPFFGQRNYLAEDDPAKAFELGSEDSPGAFIDALVEVIEECDRVLAPHGSLCIELGDKYAGSGGAGGDYQPGGWKEGQPMVDKMPAGGELPERKSLCLTPELLRLTLAYGQNPLTGLYTPRWRIRNVVRWWRPNPMPSILSDKFRPATSDMLVACRDTTRYFDAEAALNENGGPQQDTWRIPTQGTTEAHYAVWPDELCIVPVKTMCPLKVCRVCGKPSERIIEVEYEGERDPESQKNEPRVRKFRESGDVHASAQGMAHGRAAKKVTTVGWTDCQCDWPYLGHQGPEPSEHGRWRRGCVLDPFAGTFVTGAVAIGHGRDAIGIDLDKRNALIAERRVGALFLSIEGLDEVPHGPSDSSPGDSPDDHLEGLR